MHITAGTADPGAAAVGLTAMTDACQPTMLCAMKTCDNNAATPQQRGFTLLELMTALTVAGILVAVGVPAMTDMTQNQRIGAAAEDLQVDFALARSEAVTRATNVTVCTSSNGTTCTNSDWANGRIVFADANANGTLDPFETDIRHAVATGHGLTATASVAGGVVTFNARGQVNTPIVIGFCKTGLKGRNVSIKSTGHPSVIKPTVLCP